MIDLILNFIVNQKNNFKKLGIYFLHTNPPPPKRFLSLPFLFSIWILSTILIIFPQFMTNKREKMI